MAKLFDAITLVKVSDYEGYYVEDLRGVLAKARYDHLCEWLAGKPLLLHKDKQVVKRDDLDTFLESELRVGDENKQRKFNRY